MIDITPLGPWQNPHLDEGVYEATVDSLAECTYGAGNDPMLKIIFCLPDKQAFFVTHLYFPNGYSIPSQQRLWHFCQAVGMDQYMVNEHPEAFKDRKLQLYVHTVHPTDANYGSPYCDVKYFLPAGEHDKEEKPESEDW